ncbi:hypothetical protein NDU88_005883 [Pleurodeles waltl]|uniref:Uncharacterized protein n=1 Tax=Pleurodeles waltl TaxID=8319 RepID=A0AAV7L8V5_PLEWA|nr:hypothetical protein NDU88_005883 [Pleurodeles waltl]
MTRARLGAGPTQQRNEGARGTIRGLAGSGLGGVAKEKPNGQRYGLVGEGCGFPHGDLVCWCLARGLVMGPFEFRDAGLVVRSLLGAPGSPESGAACLVMVHGCALRLTV